MKERTPSINFLFRWMGSEQLTISSFWQRRIENKCWIMHSLDRGGSTDWYKFNCRISRAGRKFCSFTSIRLNCRQSNHWLIMHADWPPSHTGLAVLILPIFALNLLFLLSEKIDNMLTLSISSKPQRGFWLVWSKL